MSLETASQYFGLDVFKLGTPRQLPKPTKNKEWPSLSHVANKRSKIVMGLGLDHHPNDTQSIKGPKKATIVEYTKPTWVKQLPRRPIKATE